jgi:hypothetical protein
MHEPRVVQGTGGARESVIWYPRPSLMRQCVWKIPFINYFKTLIRFTTCYCNFVNKLDGIIPSHNFIVCVICGQDSCVTKRTGSETSHVCFKTFESAANLRYTSSIQTWETFRMHAARECIKPTSPFTSSSVSKINWSTVWNETVLNRCLFFTMKWKQVASHNLVLRKKKYESHLLWFLLDFKFKDKKCLFCRMYSLLLIYSQPYRLFLV